MNFLPGRLEGDKLELPFGDRRCPSACGPRCRPAAAAARAT